MRSSRRNCNKSCRAAASGRERGAKPMKATRLKRPPTETQMRDQTRADPTRPDQAVPKSDSHSQMQKGMHERLTTTCGAFVADTVASCCLLVAAAVGMLLLLLGCC